jgi:AraC family transcriptional regulator
VAQRREAAGVVLSEVVHREERSFPRHAHERTYVSLLLDGSYAEQLGRRRLEHAPMSVAFRPAGTEHTDGVGRNGGRFFMAELASTWIGGVQGGNSLAGPAALRDPGALFALLRLYGEFRAWDVCSAEVAQQHAALLIESSARVSRRRHTAWLERLRTMVHDTFREPVRLEALAAEAGVHPSYAAYAFRSRYGRTPAELARALRVQRVCEGLRDPRRSLADLAYDAGFSDQAHMTRIVRRLVGMTPGRLRTLMQ